ncbi:MAG: ABC transporter permease [Actinobacteria bacterium]|nr:ABC transporter permease [Actinomycetota bacterium]NBT36726.1 ABC transporter permease [Actinomycetota bacterium]NBY12123.1 ABC transporter permease [Actinomycetota bacterium]NCZ91455.1 ABC transporter permease [Actinomycetota bacterium]
MGKYVLKRIGLALVTVFLITAAIFFMTHVLPGNPAERILGNTAERANVIALEKELGIDKPLLTQYWKWLSDTASGDLGGSIQFSVGAIGTESGTPVTEVLLPALGYSLRLAALAFIVVVPLSIAGGVLAGVNRGKRIDRILTVGGLSAAVVPEFVWAVILAFVVGVKFHWLPVNAYPDTPDPGFFTVIYHLILPAFALMLVLFGYISRIARAGVIEAYDSDYVRTAVLKGLTQRKAVTRHILRNALLPTIAVVASQIPYLIGGLVAVEIVFNYPGFGGLLRTSVQYRDYPVLQASVLIIGLVIVSVQLIADVLFAVLNPRIRQKIEQ